MEDKLPWEIEWEKNDMRRRSDIHWAVQQTLNQLSKKYSIGENNHE